MHIICLKTIKTKCKNRIQIDKNHIKHVKNNVKNAKNI